MALLSLGKVSVSTAATPVRCTINQTTPSARLGVQSLSVFAAAGNTGANIYVGSSAMVPSTLVGVYAIVPKGSVISLGVGFSPAGVNANEVYLCSDTDNDYALVSGTVQ